MIVVDASLAAKWLFHEADSEQALRFLRHYKGELAAPDLIYVEVAGAVVRRGNEFKSRQESALQALETWTQTYAGRVVTPFETTPNRLHVAGRMALQIGHPLKDCLYLALAVELGCELATCDAKFAAKSGLLDGRVKLLEAFDV